MNRQLLSRRLVVGAILSTVPVAVRAQNSSSDPLRNLLNRIPGVTGKGAALSQNQIGLGLKDALKVASQRVVGRVGKADGYNGDPAIRIPLPEGLQTVEQPLRA